jgi:3-dehydroquinate dehydratase-2
VLNGPNLGRLGTREPDVYGTATYDELVETCGSVGEQLALTVDVRQTDDESTYLGWLHEAADSDVQALVLNPAAWTHTSVAVRDAVSMLKVPFVEVHLSNPLSREEFRHTSLTAGKAVGVIAGFGLDSYRLALQALAVLLAD